jgi:hypothetical protein
MERTERYKLWKEKAHELLYGEENDGKQAVMLGKVNIPKWVFAGKVPDEIEITIRSLPDKK